MGDISANFSRSEFACKCGCGQDTVDTELVMLSELVRRLNGNKSITPNSGNRCEARNKATIGASKKSYHLYGKAADLPIDNPSFVAKKLRKRFPNKYGIIVYKNRIHVDSRAIAYSSGWKL